MVLAGIAGLVMFRAQVRRLRALEGLATRVAAGDLAVRVGDSNPDEIGRLARQLDRMTEAMADDRRQVQAADDQRRKLLANISHELATPLTSIRGFAETLLDPSIQVSDEERTDYLHRVLDEAQRLDLLTRDVLDLARLEAGSPLTLAPLDLAELSRNTVERFTAPFAAAGLKLDWRGPLDRAPIRGDGRRLEQVLDNLLMNALRYVPRGGRVEVALETPATLPFD
jgi:two-component system OmpR family sensor kinase